MKFVNSCRSNNNWSTTATTAMCSLSSSPSSSSNPTKQRLSCSKSFSLDHTISWELLRSRAGVNQQADDKDCDNQEQSLHLVVEPFLVGTKLKYELQRGHFKGFTTNSVHVTALSGISDFVAHITHILLFSSVTNKHWRMNIYLNIFIFTNFCFDFPVSPCQVYDPDSFFSTFTWSINQILQNSNNKSSNGYGW